MAKARATKPKMVSAQAIARMIGQSVEQVYRLTREGIIESESVPGNTARMYPMENAMLRYCTHLRDKLNNRSDVNEAKAEAELVKKELEIRRLEIKVAQEEGQAHDASIIEDVWNDIMGTFKMRLLSFPQTVSDKLVGLSSRDEITEVLRTEIYDLCTLLAAYDARQFFARHHDYDEDEEVDEDGEAADEAEDAEG